MDDQTSFKESKATLALMTVNVLFIIGALLLSLIALDQWFGWLPTSVYFALPAAIFVIITYLPVKYGYRKHTCSEGKKFKIMISKSRTLRIASLTTLSLIVAITSAGASESKPRKLAKYIYYSGEIIKKAPEGKGKLFIQLGKDCPPSLEITGTFHNNTILNGTYSNQIYKEDVGYRMTSVFNFDSITYSIDKKKHNVTFKCYDVKFGMSTLEKPSWIEIEYIFDEGKDKTSKGWHISKKPYSITLDVRKKNYTYKYTTQLGQEKAKSCGGMFFESISLPLYSLEDINNSTKIVYDNGAEVVYDGKNFTSKWGNSTATGVYVVDNYGKRIFKELILDIQNLNFTSHNLKLNNYGGLEGKIIYADGSWFNGEIKPLNVDPFGLNLLNSEFNITPSDYEFGKFQTADHYLFEYNNGEIFNKDAFLSRTLKAYKVKAPGYPDAPYIMHRTASNEVVEDNRETLSSLINRGEEKYKNYGKIDIDNLFADEYYYNYYFDYNSPVVFRDSESFKYNESTGILSFPGNGGQEIVSNPNPNPKEFYVKVAHCLYLTYPKARISLHHGQNIFGDARCQPTLETAKIPKELYNSFSDKECDIVWVFKIVKFGRYELFGKTTRLYIVDHQTQEILADISESLNESKASFKKESHEVYKKKTYHERGRIENCGICLGTGMGWQGGICPFCGGKGWYIEHEW